MNFFSKKVFSFKEKYFGLDLGNLTVKAVQIEDDGCCDKVVAFSSQRIPIGCIEDGRIINKEKTVEVIKTVIQKAGPKKINTRKVICSLPESKVFLRILSIPLMAETEIEAAIKWEIEASIPLAIDQVYYDWQLIEKHKGGQDVLTVAVDKMVVNELVEILEMAGLEVHGLESESTAIARSLIFSGEDGGEVGESASQKKGADLIVDLGGQGTGFILTEGNVPFFTSGIPFSSVGVTSAIAKILGISFEEAEKVKIAQGMKGCGTVSDSQDSLGAYFESLSVEIEKSIDFCRSINRKNQFSRVENIIFCGGGANLKGLVPCLSKRLGRQIKIGDPWVNFNLGNNLPVINREKSLEFVTAIGLAMRKK